METGRDSVTLESSYTGGWLYVGAGNSLSVEVDLNNNDAEGLIKIQASNTPKEPGLDVSFDDGSGTETTSRGVSAGVDVDEGYSIDNATFDYYRFVYVRSAGDNTNTLTLKASVKPKKG